MTRGKYDPTVALGDQRWRPLKQTALNPNNGIQSIEIKDEIVILAEDDKGNLVEQTLREVPAFSVNITPELLLEEFPELGLDYQPTGRIINGVQAFMGYVSFIRAQEKKRDLELVPTT